MPTARPNCFLIGAQKAGTTLLYELLGQHRAIWAGEPKEPSYFSVPERHQRGLAWYEGLYASAGDHAVICDGSTTYSLVGVYPETPGRIAGYAPDARIIYLVRHPLRRIESSWVQRRSQAAGAEADFNRAVREDPRYLDGSRYLRQEEAYRAHYPAERTLVLFFEDLVADPADACRRCFEFLDVDPAHLIDPDAATRNPSQGKRSEVRLLRRARALPGARALRRALPHGVRRALRLPFTREIGGRPRWEPATREWAASQLAAETAEFLRRHGRDPGHWDLAAGP